MKLILILDSKVGNKKNLYKKIIKQLILIEGINKVSVVDRDTEYKLRFLLDLPPPGR